MSKLLASSVIDKDIMRYKKNTLAANLALLALVAGCIYFIILYSQVAFNEVYHKFHGETYYKPLLAGDIIYNLFFLLLTFLCSEQVKNYNRKLFVLQLVLGVLQIARIFVLPLQGITTMTGGIATISLSSFIGMAVALACSGLLLIASAVIGYIRSKQVETFINQVESGEVDINAALKEEGGND